MIPSEFQWEGVLEDFYKIDYRNSVKVGEGFRCKRNLESKESIYDCVMKIYTKNKIKFNLMRGVSVSANAYYSFIANDIEGVQKLVDYLEDEDNVYLVYQNTPQKSQTLKTFIYNKYAKKIQLGHQKISYENVSLELFKKVTTTLLELFNHGISNKSLTSENIIIDESLKPLLVKFQFSDISSSEYTKEWTILMNQLGLLLFELWMGHSLDNIRDLQFYLSSNEDIEIPDVIRDFLEKSLGNSLQEQEFYDLLEKLY